MRLGGRVVTTAELHELFAATPADRYVDTFAIGDDAHLVLPFDTPRTTATTVAIPRCGRSARPT